MLQPAWCLYSNVLHSCDRAAAASGRREMAAIVSNYVRWPIHASALKYSSACMVNCCSHGALPPPSDVPRHPGVHTVKIRHHDCHRIRVEAG